MRGGGAHIVPQFILGGGGALIVPQFILGGEGLVWYLRLISKKAFGKLGSHSEDELTGQIIITSTVANLAEFTLTRRVNY